MAFPSFSTKANATLKFTGRVMASTVMLLLWIAFAVACWHPVITSFLLGMLYAGIELAAVHRAGHDLRLRQWWSKQWEVRAPKSLQIYHHSHMAHHYAESAYEDDPSAEALEIRKKYGKTPLDVWIFIIFSHFVIGVVAGVITSLHPEVSGTEATSILLFVWAGALTFYGMYEAIHRLTHMPEHHPPPGSWKWLWMSFLVSRMHIAHHDRQNSNFGIWPSFNIVEYAPHWLLKGIFTVFGLVEEAVLWCLSWVWKVPLRARNEALSSAKAAHERMHAAWRHSVRRRRENTA